MTSAAEAGLMPLPTISDRLKHLKPSQELLDFYRHKIETFEEEHADMLAKLDRYKLGFEEQVMLVLSKIAVLTSPAQNAMGDCSA